MRLPRFRCAACGEIEAGVGWASHCRSTPELDRLRAHLCALMTYKTAADVLGQMFPVEAGRHHKTLRRRRDPAVYGGVGGRGHPGLDLHPELRKGRAASRG